MKFTSPFISEQNFITKQFWRILDTIKDAMLINSKLSKDFWAETMATVAYLENLLSTSFKKRCRKSFRLQKDRMLAIWLFLDV